MPSILTCLSISGHHIVTATESQPAISSDLSLSRFVKNPISSPSTIFRRTILLLGDPEELTVEMLIAFGSTRPLSLASDIQESSRERGLPRSSILISPPSL